MAIKGAKTIAEYAFRKWMEQEGFQEGYFSLEMVDSREAIIRDSNGDSMKLVYEPTGRIVYPIC